MPDTSFHFLKRIKRLELQDNEIQEIRKGTFQVRCIFFFRKQSRRRVKLLKNNFPATQGDIHSTLEEVNMAFNHLGNIQTHTFVDLTSLTSINLEDNKIDRIERRAFMNMNRLKYINLRGNKIKDITDEAFQVSFKISKNNNNNGAKTNRPFTYLQF